MVLIKLATHSSRIEYADEIKCAFLLSLLICDGKPEKDMVGRPSEVCGEETAFSRLICNLFLDVTCLLINCLLINLIPHYNIHVFLNNLIADILAAVTRL